MILCIIFSGLLALILLLSGSKIMTLWVGKEEASASAEILKYLTIAFLILAINIVPYYVLLAVGRVKVIAMSNIVSGIISIIAIYLLVEPYGLNGIGMGKIIYSSISLLSLISLIEYFITKNKRLT